ncbi:CPBP family intramembrane glutamic endopeptidase [Clostridium sp. UBA1056]|uniref:CPBP family intramembrane glutamic endopeptidase n=1 Tax=unclassified Clostridium TaxID=2614128 RepID=UPI003216DB73
MKLEIYLKLLGNLFIIFMIYILPLLFFLKTMVLERNSKLIKTLVCMAYILLYLILPELYTNMLPFILIIFILINWTNSQYTYEDYITYRFSLSKFKLSKGIKYVAITYGLTLIGGIIWYIIMFIFNIPIEQQEVVALLSSYDLISFVITIPFTVIFAPVVEEFAFRYLLYGKFLRKRLGGKIGFILSASIVSILFASIHFSISAFATLFIISFFNCYLIEKKGFWYSVFTHLFVNGVSTAFLLLQKIILYLV